MPKKTINSPVAKWRPPPRPGAVKKERIVTRSKDTEIDMSGLTGHVVPAQAGIQVLLTPTARRLISQARREKRRRYEA
jgi:hypothetical protein